MTQKLKPIVNRKRYQEKTTNANKQAGLFGEAALILPGVGLKPVFFGETRWLGVMCFQFGSVTFEVGYLSDKPLKAHWDEQNSALYFRICRTF